MLDLLAVEAGCRTEGRFGSCVVQQFAQAQQVEHTRRDARQQLPVIHGLECVAEQKIDQQIFIRHGQLCPERRGRRVLPHGGIQHGLEPLRQVLHIVENHPAREKPPRPAAQPRQAHQTPVLIPAPAEPPRQHRHQLLAVLVQQPLHPPRQQQNERQPVLDRPRPVLCQSEKRLPRRQQRRIKLRVQLIRHDGPAVILRLDPQRRFVCQQQPRRLRTRQ